MFSDWFKKKGAQLDKVSPLLSNPSASNLRKRYSAGERDFVGCDFSGQNLSGLKFLACRFSRCNFAGTNFSKTNFSSCIVLETNFQNAILEEVIVNGGCWDRLDFRAAILRKATFIYLDMMECFLGQADLSEAHFFGVNLSNSIMFRVNLSGTDLSMMVGLSQATESTDRIFAKKGGLNVRALMPNIVDEAALDLTIKNFAKRAEILAGVQDPSLRVFAEVNDLVDFLGSTQLESERIAAFREACRRSSDRRSVFISYSSKDGEMVERLHHLLSQTGVSVWFAPKEMKAGGEITDQLNRAIDSFDYVITVVSQHSLKSAWVSHEIVRAKRREKEARKTIVHPVRLVDYQDLDSWKVPDPETGEDYAEQLRTLFIPDFSMWRDQVAFQNVFVKFARDLEIV